MRRLLGIALLLIVWPVLASAKTDYIVGAGWDKLIGTWHYQFGGSRTGPTGHCKAAPTEVCDSDNGTTSGLLACSTAADVCMPVIAQWDDQQGLPRAWIDSSGALTSSSNSAPGSGLIARLFGGTSFSLFNSSGPFGIQIDAVTPLGCLNVAQYVNSNLQTTFGNMNGCSPTALNAQLGVIGPAGIPAAGLMTLRAAGSQTGPLLRTETSAGVVIDQIEADGDTCIGCGGAASGRLHVSVPPASVGLPAERLEYVLGTNNAMRDVIPVKAVTAGPGANSVLISIPIPSGIIAEVTVDMVVKCSVGCASPGTGGVGTTIGRFHNIGGTVARIGTDANGVQTCTTPPCTFQTGGVQFVEDMDGTESFDLNPSGGTVQVRATTTVGAGVALVWSMMVTVVSGGS